MAHLHTWLDMGLLDAPDILCGGTPCQAFSVAGLRRSLDDAHGNLSLVFCDLANAIDTRRARDREAPCIIFWENVPGVLNTQDNAFGCFLAGLAGEDDPPVPPGGRWTDAGYVYGPERAIA
jgi:DNA (cytosine-5)-methyltransferase 1